MVARLSASQMAERVLTAGERESATADEAVEELAAVFSRLEEAMSAVLGEAGHRAMFSRCLRKTKPAHPCLDGVVLADAGPEPYLGALLNRLRREEPGSILAAGRALMTGFIELLQTLIGDELTEKMFRRTWPAAFTSADDEAENP